MTMTSDQVFDHIEMIAKASGNSKKKYLHRDMIPYLAAAYNPYKRYYTTKCRKGEGYSQFDNISWNILGHLSARRLSGYDAEATVAIHTQSLTWKSAELFKRILNKDLRMGMGAKTINKVFPRAIPTHDIMLAKKVNWERVRYPCFISPKIDGVRAVYKYGEFYSRGGHKYKGLQHLKDQLKDITVPLDGELIVSGVSFQVGSGMIRSDQRTPGANFRIFELPTMPDDFQTRVIMMEDFTDYSPNVSSVPHFMINNQAEAMEYYRSFRSLGYEGAVVKSLEYRYVGTRSWHWMKVKPLMKDLELKVIKVYEGTGKYRGKLGGVTVEYFGTKGSRIVDIGSGFTDDQRDAFWPGALFIDEADIIDKYIQAEAMEETDDGSLRHPIFKEVKDV